MPIFGKLSTFPQPLLLLRLNKINIYYNKNARMWARARAQKRAKFGVLLDFFGLKEKNQKIMVDLFAFLEYNTQVKTKIGGL